VLGWGASEVGAFWLRRLSRIYPIHLVMIILLAALVGAGLLAGLTPREPGRFAAGELLRSLLLVQSWGWSDRLAWNYPSWSISTEWAGYLAFPVLWGLVRRLSTARLALLVTTMLAALVAVEAAAGPVGLNLTYSGALGRFFPEFVAGMAIVPLAARLGAGPATSRLVGVGALGAVIATLGAPDAVVVGCLWCALAGLFMRAEAGRRALLGRVPGLAAAGVLSYAFYMSFAPVEMIGAFLWRRWGIDPVATPWLFAAVALALTLCLAVTASSLIERPVRRWLGQWLAAGHRLASSSHRG
jgi:peptidoglycan/LPS O-acetylase OafA/YrhL